MFCSNCGKELKEGAKFCTGCGAEVTENNTGNNDYTSNVSSFSQKMSTTFKKMQSDGEEVLHLESSKGMNITRSEIKIEAQRKLSGRYGEWFKSILFYLLAVFVLMFISFFAFGKLTISSYYSLYSHAIMPFARLSRLFWFFVIILAVVALMLLGVLFEAVMKWCAVFTLEDKQADGVKIFWYFIRNQKNRVLKANVLVLVYTFCWSLLFTIPGIVKSLSYAMTNYLLAKNPELSANDAINLSREMMHGYKLELLILRVSFFFWQIAQVYTGGVINFYLLPYQNVTEIKFFDLLYAKYQNEAEEAFE